MNTNHVYQKDCEASGISRDGVPSDRLRTFASIPKGTFHRACDGDSQGGGDEQEGCREYGEGTHCLSWKGQKEVVKQGGTRRKREEVLSST